MLALTLLASLLQADSGEVSPAVDFSHSYSVWASTDHGRCIFWLTDAGEDAKQLTESLRQGYDKAAGIEILTSDDTPPRCVSSARKAVLKAGFHHVRVRPGTERDRSPGIF